MRVFTLMSCSLLSLVALELPDPAPPWVEASIKPTWRQQPLSVVLPAVGEAGGVTVVASGEVLSRGGMTLTLLAANKLPLTEVMRTVETAAGLVLVAEPLRLRVYTSEEWDAARRRTTNLGARSTGMGWRSEDFFKHRQRNEESFAGSGNQRSVQNFNATEGNPVSERLKALVDNPDRPVLVTPEEAAALREDLARLRAATIRPVAWRLCTGILPPGAAPISDGAVAVAAARAIFTTLAEPRTMVLAGMFGQNLSGAQGHDASLIVSADVVSGMLDPKQHSGFEGLAVHLRTLPSSPNRRLVGQLTWCVPSGAPVDAPTQSGFDLTKPQSQVTFDKNKDKDTATLDTQPPETIHGTKLIMRLERWWRWDQPLDVWLDESQALVLLAPGPLVGSTAVAILLPESP